VGKFRVVYMCQKLWKSVGSRHSYCNNNQAYFLWPTLYRDVLMRVRRLPFTYSWNLLYYVLPWFHSHANNLWLFSRCPPISPNPISPNGLGLGVGLGLGIMVRRWDWAKRLGEMGQNRFLPSSTLRYAHVSPSHVTYRAVSCQSVYAPDSMNYFHSTVLVYTLGLYMHPF